MWNNFASVILRFSRITRLTLATEPGNRALQPWFSQKAERGKAAEGNSRRVIHFK